MGKIIELLGATFLGVSLCIGTMYKVPQEKTASEVYSSVEASVVKIVIPGQGSGTGFVVRENGTILTNAHVVTDNLYVKVLFVDGRELVGEVQIVDPTKDLALIRVPEGTYEYLTVNKSIPDIGETVYSCGNPLGLNYIFTKGMLSRIYPGSEKLRFLLDLNIYAGNSGGPLLNSKGEVIGVVRAVLVSFDRRMAIAVSSQSIHEFLWRYDSLSMTPVSR